VHSRIGLGRFILASLLALSLLTGCGGQSRQSDPASDKPGPTTYERDMREVILEFGEVSAVGFGWLEVDTNEEAARLAQGIADDLQRVSAHAEAIDAPSDVVEEHAAFISALNRLAEIDESLAKSGGEKRVAFDLQEQAIEDLNRTLGAIQSKGYDLNWK